jgi:hypothetical protein
MVRSAPPNFSQPLVAASTLLILALGIGVLGYHHIARLSWIDAVLNASMILTGMGPVAVLTTDASKLFASVYALFSGIVFLTATGIVLGPVVHRVLHRFHLEDDSGD